MSRNYRLLLQAMIVIAASSLAFATIRKARHAPPIVSTAERAATVIASELETNNPKIALNQARQVPADMGKQHLTSSPDQRYTVYHLPFNPYGTSPKPLTFIAVDNRTGEPIRSIPINWRARTVSSVIWIDGRTVAVLGEAGYLAVFDVEMGEQTHNFGGRNFAISPNGSQVVYTHDFNPNYGYISPEFKSDYVLLGSLKQPELTNINDRNDHSDSKVIYPEIISPNKFEQKAFKNLADRHQIKSTLAWSEDSQRIAFVETHQEKLWLVVLQPKVQGEDVTIDSQKVELDSSTDNISSLSWVSNSDQIKVSNDLTTLLVDLNTGTVQPVPSDQ
ncbi:MAG: hypothetical protein MSG64_16000 [Pyrinomonadaceae bacterium MAG19_C2-C3]|nr:hypothetical protein [Pyrinomonadaceae bacterium MAG19_C2-C3]